MRKKDNLIIKILALVSLFTSIRLFARFLSTKDFEKELLGNEQLRKADSDTKLKSRAEITALLVQRGRNLRIKSIKSAGWLLVACIIGYSSFLYKNFNIYNLITILNETFYPLLSLFLFAFGTLGRLGWEIQSNRKDTVYEQLDDMILWSSYFFGTVFGVLSILK